MTKFRLFKTERVCRQHFQFDENGRDFSERTEKNVGKGEMLIFNRFVLQTDKNQGLCGKELKSNLVYFCLFSGSSIRYSSSTCG